MIASHIINVHKLGAFVYNGCEDYSQEHCSVNRSEAGNTSPSLRLIFTLSLLGSLPWMM